jgi:hypothetical protein
MGYIEDLTSSFPLGSALWWWCWVVCNLKGWVVLYLESYQVDDIDVLDGRSDYLCGRLCCIELWLVICERVVRLFGWLFVDCSVGWITISEFNATVSMIWVRGVCGRLSVWMSVLFLVPGRVSCVCRARFAGWSWERVASWLVGAGSER